MTLYLRRLMVMALILFPQHLAAEMKVVPNDSQGPAYGENSCSNPKQSDQYGFRESTEDEKRIHGSNTAIFMYSNSTFGCSSDIYFGVSWRGMRFKVEVTTGGQDVNFMEQIKLEPQDSGIIVENHLLIPDSSEVGKIIIRIPTS